MYLRGRIIAENVLKVDHLAVLFLLRPRSMPALHSNLHAHLGCWRHSSTYAQVPDGVRSEEAKDIQALGWCPGSVVLRDQFDLRIPYKQLKPIFRIWDILQCDIYMLPGISGVGLN